MSDYEVVRIVKDVALKYLESQTGEIAETIAEASSQGSTTEEKILLASHAASTLAVTKTCSVIVSLLLAYGVLSPDSFSSSPEDCQDLRSRFRVIDGGLKDPQS